MPAESKPPGKPQREGAPWSLLGNGQRERPAAGAWKLKYAVELATSKTGSKTELFEVPFRRSAHDKRLP